MCRRNPIVNVLCSLPFNLNIFDQKLHFLQIKSVDYTWHEARRILRKDSRYENCDLLEKDAKERLFDAHVQHLERKRREIFFQVIFD